MKKIITNWTRYFPLIGIVIFAVILSRIDLGSFLLILKKVQYPFLFLLPFFILSIFFVQTLKWQQLLKIQRLNYGFWYLFKIQVIGNYYALLTPSRVGYFIKISYLNNSFGVASTSVIIDRILDILVLIIFASIGAFLLIGQFPHLIVQISIFTIFFLGVLLFLWSKTRTRFLFSFFKKIIPLKFHESLKTIFHDFYNNLPRQKKIIFPFLLTILTWFLIYSQGYVIAMAFNIPIDFWHFIFYLPIVTVVGMIPITISGLGTKEAALILLFSQFSISIESIVAFSLTSLILTGYIPAIYGGFLSFKFKKHESAK